MEVRLEQRPLAALAPYAQNAKRHSPQDVGLIAQSIARFGFNDPIGILSDGTVVEGHGRLMAAQQMGMTEVPVLVLEGFTEQQAALYRIAHNKITLSATFDFQKLAVELRSLINEDISFNQLGFEEALGRNIVAMFTEVNAQLIRDGYHRSGAYDQYEVVWDGIQQKRQWASYVKMVQQRYPELSIAEAITRHIRESGVLDAALNASVQPVANEAEGKEHV